MCLIEIFNNFDLIYFFNSKKVEWLYGGEKIDKEAYLLGKPIDKLITEAEQNDG